MPAARHHRKRRSSAATDSSASSMLFRYRLAAFLGEPVDQAEDDPALAALMTRTAKVYVSSLTPQTRATYVRRWRDFEEWAHEVGLEPLPAAPETVLMYLLDLVDGDDPVGIVTVRGRLAAINRVHLESGLAQPGADPALPVFLRGLARIAPPASRADPIAALKVEDLRHVVKAISNSDPRQSRDRALLELHRAGLSDRELGWLTWNEVAVRNGVVALITHPVRGINSRHRLRDSRTSQPAAALAAWRAVAGEDPPYVFASVDGLGQRSDRRTHPSEIRRIIDTRLRSLADQSGADDDALSRAIRLMNGIDPLALRDRALLLLGFAGAFRRIDLVDLLWSDVHEEPGGLVVRLRFSKTDRNGMGRDVGIPYGKSPETCPASAVLAWRGHMQSHLGVECTQRLPVFVTVGRVGRLGTQHMTPESVTRVVVDRARAAGIDGRWGGRSLRAGFISTAAELDLPLEVIARQSRHATLDNLVRYIRRDLFQRNAAQQVGL